MDAFADKYPALTPYHYAANNPMRFIDINGDTITVSDALAGTEEWQAWANSEKGKAFYAAYGAGGEYGTTNVHFRLVKIFWGKKGDLLFYLAYWVAMVFFFLQVILQC